MNAGFLDTITNTFVAALQAGQQTLATFSLPLLGILAIISFYAQMGPLVAGGGAGAGEAIAGMLFTAVRFGVFYFLMLHLTTLATAAYQTFLQWGAGGAGGGFSTATFLTPSAMIDLGFANAAGFTDMSNRLSLWGRMTHPLLPWVYAFAGGLVALAFAFVALHLMMTIIEYHLAVLVGTVLIPWGVLQPTAFFSEFSIGWLTGGLVRVLVTGAMVGIGRPLFRDLTPTLTAGGDPTYYSALIVGIASGIFAILAWVVPGRAAAIAGRGVSLALHGGTLIAGAAGPLRAVITVTSAIRGISSLLRR